jgi:hypothetical protein
MWHHNLHQFASDDWGREALRKVGGDLNAGAKFAIRVKRVADKLESDPAWHSESIRSKVGRQGAGSQRQMAMDHARVVVKNADRLTSRWVKDDSERGGHFEEALPGLVDHMLEHGKPPTLAALEELPRDGLPDAVGQKYELQKVGVGNIRKATNTLFSKFIGPQINWISRQPMFIHNYTDARLQYAGMARAWRKAGMGDEAVEKLLHDNSMDLALKNTIQYVHNPQLRSEMSTVTRNLAPFWFAQEQFYKRWGRTFAYAPAAFTKAQLVSHGLRHSGIVHTDPENGQEYFVYPGSALVQQVLVDALSRFGINGEVPVEAGLTGQVNMLNPAIQRIGAPNFGPVVVVPLNGLKTLDPHMTQAINSVEGSVASQSGFIKAILPSTLQRALTVAFPNMINSAQYASAQMQAIQSLEATGHGMGTPAIAQVASRDVANPKPGDYVADGPQSWVYQPDGKWQLNNAATLEKFKERVNNWARIFMFTRLVYGFAAPAAPENQFNPGNMHNELQTLMNEMPVDQAMTTFLAEHPDATAETVFQTQTPGGAFLPATKAAMSFLEANPTLVKDHPLAASYLIPAASTSGKFDLAAYQEQLAQGWRVRKSPDQFYQEILYQSAAQIYYRVENVKNQMIAQKSMPTNLVDDYWTQWQEGFMQANPVFASLLGTGTTGSTLAGTAGAGGLGRQQIMEDIGAALSDGSAPQNAQTAAVGSLYNSWVAWQSMTNTYGNPNQPAVNTGMRIQYDEQYAQFVAGFEQANPSVQPLVRRAIAPDLSTALNDLAAQGTVVTI